LEQWGKVTKESFGLNGGRSLLLYHSCSVFGILRKLYPDVDWNWWQFSKTRNKAWKMEEKKKVILLKDVVYSNTIIVLY
jgi:hypothetical protein